MSFIFGASFWMAANVFGFDLKIQLRGEAHGAQQPQMIFAKAFFRLADRTNDFRMQIFFATNPVVNFFCERIVKKSVHREITARRIRLGIGENDLLRTPAILIFRLGPECGDLKLLSAFNAR